MLKHKVTEFYEVVGDLNLEFIKNDRKLSENRRFIC